IGKVAEIPSLAIVFRVPIISQLDLGILITLRRQVDERKSALRALHAAHFFQPELVAIEVERLIEIGNTHHGVQIFHRLASPYARTVRCAPLSAEGSSVASGSSQGL